ncbi:MAG: GNAT family N-acetyltransferase, partial [Clostridia bacterium]|nr:GNAT family N-acetyltransferase [Clostridia bacterium]
EGKWKNDRDYVCMHRVAVHPEAKGCGVAAALVDEAVKIALSVGIYDLKCDTHEVNASMRRMLEKNGFEYCGVIYLSLDGEPRVAYQRILD